MRPRRVTSPSRLLPEPINRAFRKSNDRCSIKSKLRRITSAEIITYREKKITKNRKIKPSARLRISRCGNINHGETWNSPGSGGVLLSRGVGFGTRASNLLLFLLLRLCFYYEKWPMVVSGFIRVVESYRVCICYMLAFCMNAEMLNLKYTWRVRQGKNWYLQGEYLWPQGNGSPSIKLWEMFSGNERCNSRAADWSNRLYFFFRWYYTADITVQVLAQMCS